MIDFLAPPPSGGHDHPPDRKDPRMDEVIERGQAAAARSDAVLVGCPDEAGLLLNRGRPGARLGPWAIRRALGRLTVGCHPPLTTDRVLLADVGDIRPDGDIHETHRRVRRVVRRLCGDHRVPVLMGGSHELSGPGIEGLGQSLARRGEPRPGVLLLDAHLDVRDLRYGNTNGSPFFHLISNGYIEGDRFSVVGAQTCANAPAYAEYVRSAGGRVAWMHRLFGRSVADLVTHELDRLAQGGPVAVSVDIDVVGQAEAPGTGSPSAAGLEPGALIRAARRAGEHPAVVYLDMMEVSPPLDIDGRTALLAATVIHAFLSGLALRTWRRETASAST